MTDKLILKYPDLKIVGSRNGYFTHEDEPEIVKEIEDLKPDMLFIALPTPKKEMFIKEYKDRKIARFAFGIGGAFDCAAGKVKRAPEWMRSIGLEGLHRAVQNPGDYGKRYMKYYVPFVKLFMRELVKVKAKVPA
jgi:N-acetylglucosaminyldiphosphoundecaprenol N-acetyl-beta-D-mannosaminyltransferase